MCRAEERKSSFSRCSWARAAKVIFTVILGDDYNDISLVGREITGCDPVSFLASLRIDPLGLSCLV